MRVLILSQYYHPEPIPKPSELADELIRRGHEVSVLTGLPNYPTGKLAAGYRLVPWKRELLEGARVLRVFELPYHGGATLGRFANYGSFLVASSIGSLALGPVDAVYVWHPPLTVGLTASWIRGLRGIPYLYDVQDVWPDEAILAGAMRDGRVAQLLRRIERSVYGRASHIIVSTRGARENLLAKGIHPEKVTLVPNWIFGGPLQVPAPEQVSDARSSLAVDGRFTVTFAGNVGVVQALDTVLVAAQRLLSRNDIAFRIIGDGSDMRRLQTLAKRLSLTNLVFVGRRPATEMPRLLAASDALLVHLRRGPLEDLALPTKTLTYLAAARPLIVAAGGAAAELARDAEAGIVVPAEDPDALVAAVERLAATPLREREAMGERGRRYVAEHFSREHIVDAIERLLIGIAAE